MATNPLSQASRTVQFFQAPVLAPLKSLPIPCLMAGKSPGLGGVSSTLANFKKVLNFGVPCLINATKEKRCDVTIDGKNYWLI
jgi:hypothetical protein